MAAARVSPKSLPGKMSSVFVPSSLIWFITCCCAPRPSATTETTAEMPMMMPSMVRKVRRRWAFMARRAMRRASPKRSDSPRQEARRAPDAGSTGGLASCGVLRRSAMMAPSLISITRVAWAATAMSCVTRMMVWPSACSSCRMRMTCSPLALSSAPVGSSARMTAPPFISARAMDTRCCCPPDSCPGRCCMRSARPRRIRPAAASTMAS